MSNNNAYMFKVSASNVIELLLCYMYSDEQVDQEHYKLTLQVVFKRLSHVPIQTNMHCFYRSKDSPLKSFLTIYSIIFYG